MNRPVQIPLHPRDEAELRWYFNEAEGELQLKSNYPQMIHQIQMGRRTSESYGNWEFDPRAIEAAERMRIVEKTLAMIGDHALTLQFWLTHPPKSLEPFGDLGGLVVLAARQSGFAGDDPVRVARMLVDLCRDKGQGSQGLKELVLRDAERMRAQASQAYSRAVIQRRQS